MTPFEFACMALTAARLTRLVVADDWPPSEWLRNKVADRTGEDSSWTTLVTCPWCWGVWTTAALFLTDHYLWNIPTWLLAMGAAMEIVGYLGTYDSRD